jgi:hypothetical protein
VTSTWPERCISLRPDDATVADLIGPAIAIDPGKILKRVLREQENN